MPALHHATPAFRPDPDAVRRAAALDFRVPRLPLHTVRHRALAWWNAQQREQGKDPIADESSCPPAFIDRLALNFIRHKLTDYDAHLKALTVGKKAADILKRRVLGEIARVYPELADAVERQLQRMT